MPYGKKDELPEPVKGNLPSGAQDVYMAAFNFASKKKGMDDAKASQYAWGAVSKVYKKDDSGKWIKKSTKEMSLAEEDTNYLNSDILLEMAVHAFGESVKPDDWDDMMDEKKKKHCDD
jgi:cation transport regulator